MMIMDGSDWTCSTFEAQKWRKRKCKHCFQDIEQHSRDALDDNNGYTKSDNCSRHLTLGDLCLSNEECQVEFEEDLNREVIEITKSIDEFEKWKHSDDATLRPSNKEGVQCTKSIKDYTQVSRKRSRTHDGVQESASARNSFFREIFVASKDDLQISITNSCEGENLLLQEKCRVDAGGILSRLSTVEFSSTSSLASFDPLEDNTLSSYSYSGSRDNLDGFASGDELCYPERSSEAQVAAGEGKLLQEYEEKIENLEDELKVVEREKERQIQTFDRELQGLKLELAKLSARENITIVKNRLEIEGKNQVIEELREDIVHLQSSIDDLSLNKHSEESRQDFLQGEVSRRDKKILCLEEEKKSLEERLSLAEDLQKNDRDLLDVLRHQLTTLESDLLTSEDKKKQLEREVKELKVVENELKEERENSQRFRKHADFLGGKLKLREQHVSYLEDDNVKMQQEKTDLEGKLEKSRKKVDNLSKMVKELKKDIQSYNQEVKHLNEENCQLEQAHWQVVVNQSDASGQLEDYVKDLEKRVCQGDARVRELESENESLISQSSEMLENLVLLQSEADDNKRQLQLITESYNRLQTSKTDQDKRMITLQRKLKKLQKEKKRFQIEKQEAEEKISLLKLNDDKVSAKCDDIEKGYKMLQLKLQSTEAKLTMVESNKIYMESKLDEYEKRYKFNKEILSKLNCAIDNYLQKFEGKISLVAAQGNWDLEPVEVKLCKIIEHSDKSNSELMVALKKNEQFAAAFDSVHIEMSELRNELSYAREETSLLKCQLKDRDRQGDQLKTCFTVSIGCLAQQNDLLQGRLDEMKELKSVMEYYEDVLKSKNNVEYSEKCDRNYDSFFVNEVCHRDSDRTHFGGADSRSADNLEVYGGIAYMDHREIPVELVEPYQNEIVNGAAELSEAVLDSAAEELDNSLDAGVLHEALDQEGLAFGPDERRDCSINEVEEMKDLAEGRFEGDSNTLVFDKQDMIDLENGCLCDSNAKNSVAVTSADFADAEHSLIAHEEDLMEEDQACDISKGGDADTEANDSIGGVNNAENESEMDAERPFTSVKCVFKGETNGAGSILDYSAMHLRKNHDDITGDLDWMKLGHGDKKTSPETSTPYYTVAVSNLDSSNGRPFKEPVSNSKPKNGADTGAKRHKLQKGAFMQISQEESGAITLTIPKSRLDDTAEDQIEDDVSQLTTKVTLSECTENPRNERLVDSTRDQIWTNDIHSKIKGDLSRLKLDGD